MHLATDHSLPLHSGINFSRLEVGGDFGGCIFALGSVLVLMAGLPQVRWFVAGAAAAAVPSACLLLMWHRHHKGPSSLWSPIDIDLTGGCASRRDKSTTAAGDRSAGRTASIEGKPTRVPAHPIRNSPDDV